MKVGAILLDTRSIQKYIFSCNKLQTNIGASYLVDAIFTKEMVDVLKDAGCTLPDITWQEYTAQKEKNKKLPDLMMVDHPDIDCEIAYIGGGNMLILLRDGGLDDEALWDKCRNLVRQWSRRVLLKAPGLKTGAAIDVVDILPGNFKQAIDSLYQQLKEHQNTILPCVDLPYTGLTLECDISGKVADVNSYKEDGSKRWISSEIIAKRNAYQDSRRQLEKDFLEENDGETPFAFPDELDQLGYKDKESYICVIHIDGNNMGVKFSHCRDMQERRALSLTVAQIVKDGFKTLLEKEVRPLAISSDEEKYLSLKKTKYGKVLLPIRPIIIGGDDVTFICPGRTGLRYAQAFIKAVQSKKLLNKDLYTKINKELKAEGKEISKKMSCCGGIAIVPAKYPFYRAYELAEQLCGSAKKKSRQHDTNVVDFAILHGQMAPELSQLESQTYEAPQGYLHYGPYTVDGTGENGTNLADLFALCQSMLDFPVPENKIKKLREVLQQDLHSQQLFLENSPEMRAILQKETGKEEVTAEDFWQDVDGQKKTRYMDAIEIMKFWIPEGGNK